MLFLVHFYSKNRADNFNNSGWDLAKGDAYISCEENGSWDGDVPICEPSKCKELPSVENGRIIKESEILRRVVCDACHRFTNPGAEMLQCQEGRWSPPKPTNCEGKILC